ncbi:MAG: hypothetical protein AAGE65_09405 [Planctomycetota bacterium]
MSAFVLQRFRRAPRHSFRGFLVWSLIAMSQPGYADGIPVAEHVLGDGPGKYFLIGDTAAPPDGGFGLVVVLPGGDGSADFLPFVTNIARQAVPSGYVVAQPVAIEWREGQSERVVWPTRRSRVPGMAFTTEQYVAAVIDDVTERVALHPKKRLLLAWSSGGPAAYAVMVQKESPIAGAYVAMSVFKSRELGNLRFVRGRAFRIEHSPTDFIPIRMAEAARDELSKAGASVDYVTYAGGHGWHGAIWDRLSAGFAWLDQQVTAVAEADSP